MCLEHNIERRLYADKPLGLLHLSSEKDHIVDYVLVSEHTKPNKHWPTYIVQTVRNTYDKMRRWSDEYEEVVFN